MSEHDFVHFHRRRDDDADPAALPPGMTIEQLDFFTEQTRRSVRKATRRDRAVNRIAYVVLTIGLMVSLYVANHASALVSETVVESGRAVAVESCNRDFEDRMRFRSLLNRLKDAAEASARQGRATEEQRDRAVAFYEQELKRFGLPDCRKSQDLLTSDPNDRIPKIAPYYPGAPYLPRSDG